MRAIEWLVLFMLVAGTVFAGSDDTDMPRPQVWATLTPFKSMGEFDAYLRRAREIAKASSAYWASTRTDWHGYPLLAQVVQPCDPAIQDCSEELEEVTIPGRLYGCTIRSVTHDQEPGVDEGDLVKTFDRFIIVLRHGRLFSLDMGDKPGALRLVDRVDAYAAGDVDGWINELTISGDTLLVTGHDLQPDSTTFALFRISPEGAFSLVARYLVAADDDYYPENYSTRIVDGKLIFYSRIELAGYGAGESLVLPRIRRWTEQGGYSEWQPLFGITDVYRPIQAVYTPHLHVVSACPIEAGNTLRCRSRGIIGPPSERMYVSTGNVYLWLESTSEEVYPLGKLDERPCAPGADLLAMPGWPSVAYRMSLASGALTATHTEGALSDRFALDEQGGNLWALVTRAPTGCEPGNDPDEVGAGMALAKIRSAAFSTSPARVGSSDFLRVPKVGSYQLSSRFTEGYLLFGGKQDADRAVFHGANHEEPYWAGDLAVVPLSSPERAARLALPHSVERIEFFGSNALVFGYQPNDDFAVSSVILGKLPRYSDTQAVPGVVESIGSTPAFDGIAKGDGSGLFGIPIMHTSARSPERGLEMPVSVQFFTANSRLELDSADRLDAGEQDEQANGYTCEVSCVDWSRYDNARPVIYRDRIFALMGSAFVEGTLFNGHVAEVARVDLTAAPVNPRRARH